MLALTRVFSGFNENRLLQGILLDWEVVEYWLSDEDVPYRNNYLRNSLS
jgi:hypothetical protein